MPADPVMRARARLMLFNMEVELFSQIEALESVGVNLLLMNMNFGDMSHREAMRSLRLFGREVLPAFRR